LRRAEPVIENCRSLDSKKRAKERDLRKPPIRLRQAAFVPQSRDYGATRRRDRHGRHRWEQQNRRKTGHRSFSQSKWNQTFVFFVTFCWKEARRSCAGTHPPSAKGSYGVAGGC